MIIYILAAIAVVYLLLTIINYVSGDCDFWFCPAPKAKDKLYISFDRFYALYCVAPDKWWWNEIYNRVSYHDEHLYMKSLIDRCRFRIFCRRKRNVEYEKIGNYRMKYLLERWQKDVDDYKKVMTGEDKDGKG